MVIENHSSAESAHKGTFTRPGILNKHEAGSEMHAVHSPWRTSYDKYRSQCDDSGLSSFWLRGSVLPAQAM